MENIFRVNWDAILKFRGLKRTHVQSRWAKTSRLVQGFNMNFDDVVYLLLLFFSIGFGYVQRQVKDVEMKKCVNTVVGLSIVFIVSGWYIWHSLLTVFVNAAIILYVSKRKCHLYSFAFSFVYLAFFRTTEYFGIPYPPGHTNLVQMMLTLKLVGLAFEVNTSNENKKKKDGAVVTPEQIAEKECNDIPDLTFVDIFHYAFNYAGVLTGPYYRYRTYYDSLHLPFNENVNWKEATLSKLKIVPLFAVLFLWGSYNWPISYAMTDEFYNERSFWYRVWFIWPNFFIFRMRIYIGLTLSECVMTMAGIGAYPVETEPKPGQGPTNYGAMKNILENPYSAKNSECNFEAIHNIHPYGADFCTTFRESMKHWNMCIQYWLYKTIYKRFPNKKIRTEVTMLVSAYWHGVYAGYYMCILGVPVYLPIEDIWVKLYLKENTGKSKVVWEWIIWFFKMLSLSYLAIAFLLLRVGKIMHYYHSVYYFGYIMYLVLYVVGLQQLKAKKAKLNRDAVVKVSHECVKSN